MGVLDSRVCNYAFYAMLFFSPIFVGPMGVDDSHISDHAITRLYYAISVLQVLLGTGQARFTLCLVFILYL